MKKILKVRTHDDENATILGIFEDKDTLISVLNNHFIELITESKYDNLNMLFNYDIPNDSKLCNFFAFNQTLHKSKRFNKPNGANIKETSMFHDYGLKKLNPNAIKFHKSLRKYLKQAYDTLYTLEEKLRFISEVLEINEEDKIIYKITDFKGEIIG